MDFNLTWFEILSCLTVWGIFCQGCGYHIAMNYVHCHPFFCPSWCHSLRLSLRNTSLPRWVIQWVHVWGKKKLQRKNGRRAELPLRGTEILSSRFRFCITRLVMEKGKREPAGVEWNVVQRRLWSQRFNKGNTGSVVAFMSAVFVSCWTFGYYECRHMSAMLFCFFVLFHLFNFIYQPPAIPPAFPGPEMCGSTSTSATSVPTPAAPPAPVADMHWQPHHLIQKKKLHCEHHGHKHHLIAPAPETEIPLPAAQPEATPKAVAAATAATAASTDSSNKSNNSNSATTPGQQPTANSQQAQQHQRGPGETSPRPFG